MKARFIRSNAAPALTTPIPAHLTWMSKDTRGDMQYMLDQIGLKLKEAGQEKRMSTWGVAINMLMIEAGVEYAREFIEGKITERNDQEALKRIIDSLAGGVEVDTFQIC